MNMHGLGSLSELRRLYGALPEQSLARRIIFAKLHRHHRAFIALPPFVVIASANREGAPDVSPRGDLPGCAVVLDDRTLVLPDRPGQQKADDLDERARKCLRESDLLCARTGRVAPYQRPRTDHHRPGAAGPGCCLRQTPQTALVVAVDPAWLHCGRALIRSRLWDSGSYPAADALPSLGSMIAEDIGDIGTAEAEAKLERANTVLLWGEPPSAPG